MRTVGTINGDLLPIIVVDISADLARPIFVQSEMIVDTGFTGFCSLSQATVGALNLNDIDVVTKDFLTHSGTKAFNTSSVWILAGGTRCLGEAIHGEINATGMGFMAGAEITLQIEVGREFRIEWP